MRSSLTQKHFSYFKVAVLFTFVCMNHQLVFATDRTESLELVFGELKQKIQDLSNENTLESHEHVPVTYYPNFLAQGTEETLRERVSKGANKHAWRLKKQAALTLLFCFGGAASIYGAYRAIYDNCVAQNCKYKINGEPNPLHSSLEAKAGGGGFGGVVAGLITVGSALGNAIYGIYIWKRGDKTYNSIPLANLIRSSVNIYEFKLSLEKIEGENLPDDDVVVIKEALEKYYIEASLGYSHDKIEALSKSIKFDNGQIMNIAERVYWAACGRLFEDEWEKLSPSQVVKKVLNGEEYFAAVNKALKNILDEKARDDFRIDLEEKKNLK